MTVDCKPFMCFYYWGKGTYEMATATNNGGLIANGSAGMISCQISFFSFRFNHSLTFSQDLTATWDSPPSAFWVWGWRICTTILASEPYSSCLTPIQVQSEERESEHKTFAKGPCEWKESRKQKANNRTSHWDSAQSIRTYWTCLLSNKNVLPSSYPALCPELH